MSGLRSGQTACQEVVPAVRIIAWADPYEMTYW